MFRRGEEHCQPSPGGRSGRSDFLRVAPPVFACKGLNPQFRHSLFHVVPRPVSWFQHFPVVAKQVEVQLHDAPCLVFRPSSVGGFHLLEERGHFVPGQRGGAEGHLVVEPSGRREPDGAGLPEGAEPDAGECGAQRGLRRQNAGGAGVVAPQAYDTSLNHSFFCPQK